MQLSGNIRKMDVLVGPNNQVTYNLPIGEQKVTLNEHIGSKITVEYAGEIHCVHCSRKTKKSFNQGYCYPCITQLAQCDTCIIKPELCHFHLGTCREPEWGQTHCFNDHLVYLSNTGNLKVGITRHISDNVSSRWIDQGATQAIGMYRVSNRLISGLVETALKEFIGDKTNWRTMLKGPAETNDLIATRQNMLAQAAEKISLIQQEYGLQAVQEVDMQPVEITYPVVQYPVKIKSINLDKELGFSGVLQGIKGQYLLLDGDRVINMRKYAGYHLNWYFEDIS